MTPVRLLLGLAAVGVSGWVWATRADVLWAGHYAYPVAVTVVGVVGVLLLVRTLRRRPRRRGGLLRVVGLIAVSLVAVVLLAAVAWLRPFPATRGASAVATAGARGVEVTRTATSITLRPASAEPAVGLVFQPGARVDPRAYLPLLARLSARGYLVVAVKQPLDLGLLAVDAPADVIAAHREIRRWVVAGHSLGGVAAAQYAAHPEDAERVTGLLLWASYPLDSLRPRRDLDVTSVSGSRDALSTPADIADSRALLPDDATYVEVRGGVHAYFGDYGPQPGDGTPAVGRAAAQREIVRASLALLDRVAARPGG